MLKSITGHAGRQPMFGTRSTCHCRLPIGGDACHRLGQSPERRPDVGLGVELAEDTEADRFEGTSGRACLQQRR